MRSLGFSTAATILLVTLLHFPALTFAQETTGSLEGRVLDSKGKPVGYAYVIVTGPSIQGKRGTVTTLDGRFVVLALPVGECDVKFAHVSYVEQVFETVRIRLGQRTSMGDVVLEDKVYETQGVTVTGTALPLIDPTSTELGGTLSAREYELLPLDRDYRSMATVLPEVNQSYLGDPINFGGSTGQENLYFIDGIEVTEPSRTLGGTQLPYNFVKEVEIRTGGYEAEYRSSIGGTVNAVTNSGSNELHGQVFGFFLNNRLAAEPRWPTTEPGKGDFAYYDAGLGVGGPLQKDKLWYYLSYNPTSEQQDVEIPGCGMFEDLTTAHRFAGKLTWRPSEKNSMAFTAIGDPSERRGVGAYAVVHSFTPMKSYLNPDAYLMHLETGGVSFMLDGRRMAGDNVLLRTSLSYAKYRNLNVPDTERGEEILFIDAPTAVASGGTGERTDNTSTVATAAVFLDWLTGKHELKAGLEYKSNGLDFEWSYRDLTRYSDTYYFMWIAKGSGTVSNRQPSAFLQDSWKLTDRLRINAGLRWDGQFWVATDGEIAQEMLDQWQPRAGFTWQLGDAGRHQVTGSFGRYYQELSTVPMAWGLYSDTNANYFLEYDHDPRFDPTDYDTLKANSTIQAEIESLKGQHIDEFALGYERRIGNTGKIGVRGVYRVLRDGLEDGFGPTSGGFGNPGSGLLVDFPPMKRDYGAVELTYTYESSDRLWILTSYVLSRTYGNYSGVFNTDFGYGALPNLNGSFDVVDIMADGEGLLPNDRTHVFKLASSYRVSRELTLAGVGIWETGTPLNVFGGSQFGQPNYTFLAPRGTAGRTPSIWDLSLRLAYAPRFLAVGGSQTRLTLDALHVASEREPVDFDQIRYFNVDDEGNQIDPNPTYGVPTAYQPPMAFRVGVEVIF